LNLWHVNSASAGRHALFPTEESRRDAVRALARVARDRLALFCIVDEHLHLVAIGSRATVGRLAQAIARSLGARAASRLETAHFRPVENRGHLETLVRYVLNQPAHHGLPGHPALWTGSSFPDLARARVLPELRLRLHDVLPRFDLARISEAVGLPREEITPLSLPDVRLAGATPLASAAAAALAARPALATREAPAGIARVAVARLARDAGIPLPDVANALRVWPRSVRRLAVRPVPAATLLAVRRRLTLEQLVRDARPAERE
jgi:hypothetical protein